MYRMVVVNVVIVIIVVAVVFRWSHAGENEILWSVTFSIKQK